MHKYFLIFGIITVLGLILVSGCITGPLIHTPDEVWANRDYLINKQITVEGIADYYAVACTEMYCPMDCCNTCSGGLGLRIDEERGLNVRGESEEKGNYGLYNGERVGCEGNECDIRCYPLEAGKKYRVTGILKKETWDVAPYEEFYLELINFELVE